uniref:Low-temperature-induced 65 kDa protein n=1 Tax=Solanum tuberosum TaxID=4113 RepID=M1CY00_SOLTU
MSVKEETKPEKGASMKNYLAEKFKPRDEDKALSEVISGKLAGRKDKTEGTEQAKPTEKVKENSTEKMEKPEGVATQKGSTDEQRVAPAAAAATTHVEGGGKSMINRLKGVASSWLHKAPAAAPPSQQTPTSTTHEKKIETRRTRKPRRIIAAQREIDEPIQSKSSSLSQWVLLCMRSFENNLGVSILRLDRPSLKIKGSHSLSVGIVKFSAELSKPGQWSAWGQRWSPSAGHVQGVGSGVPNLVSEHRV